MSTKSKSVPLAEFWTAVLKGIKAGTSNAEVAKSLGMEVDSFEQRRSQVGRNFALASGTYKVGEAELSGVEVMSKYGVAVSLLGKPADFRAKTAQPIECVTPGKNPVIGSTGRGRGRKSDWAAIMDLHRDVIGAGERQ
jgi:hypothetical protein